MGVPLLFLCATAPVAFNLYFKSGGWTSCPDLCSRRRGKERELLDDDLDFFPVLGCSPAHQPEVDVNRERLLGQALPVGGAEGPVRVLASVVVPMPPQALELLHKG